MRQGLLGGQGLDPANRDGVVLVEQLVDEVAVVADVSGQTRGKGLKRDELLIVVIVIDDYDVRLLNRLLGDGRRRPVVGRLFIAFHPVLSVLYNLKVFKEGAMAQQAVASQKRKLDDEEASKKRKLADEEAITKLTTKINSLRSLGMHGEADKLVAQLIAM